MDHVSKFTSDIHVEMEINKQFPMKNIKHALDAIYADSETGYVLELELKYPQHLHDDHSDYPLAPENIRIDALMYSPFMRDHFFAADAKKLTPNLTEQRYCSLQKFTVVLESKNAGYKGSSSTSIRTVVMVKTVHLTELNCQHALARNEFEKNFSLSS